MSNVVQVFDRDGPTSREKLVHVTVKASDQGKPPLEDVCTIAVNIKDKNDNKPIFDRANYDVPVAQVCVTVNTVTTVHHSCGCLECRKPNVVQSSLSIFQPAVTGPPALHLVLH